MAFLQMIGSPYYHLLLMLNKDNEGVGVCCRGGSFLLGILFLLQQMRHSIEHTLIGITKPSFIKVLYI